MTIMSETIEMNDPQAIDYAGIVQRYAPLVRARCARELSSADADDACQAVFLVLWRKHDIPPEGPRLAGWLLAVSRNVIRNAKRDIARRHRAERGAGEEMGMASDDMQHSDAEQRRLLNEELERLPRSEREAVELHHLAGHTYQDIAEAVGSKTSTVAARVQRGMGKLRDALQRRGVALSLMALPGLLSLDANEAPSPELFDRILASAPSAGSTVAATAGIPAHIIRWSRTGMSIMTRISIICVGALLGCASWIYTAEGSASESPASGEVSVGETVAEPGIIGDFGQDMAMVIRLNDPQRSWQRLLNSPFGALMTPAMRERAAVQLAKLGPAWFVYDPMSSFSENYRRQLDDGARELMALNLEDIPDAQRRLLDKVDENRHDEEVRYLIDGRGSMIVRDPAALSLLVHGLQSAFGGAHFVLQDDGSYHYDAKGGAARLSHVDDELRIMLDSKSEDLDLAWLSDPVQPAFAGADLEFQSLLHPHDIKASAALNGDIDPVQQALWCTLQITEQGLRMEAHSPPPLSGRSKVYTDIFADTPVLDREDFAAIPADALLGAAYALDPAYNSKDNFTMGLLTTLKVLLQREGRNVAKPFESVERCLLEADGALLAYLRPAPMIPALTMELSCSEEAANALMDSLLAFDGVRQSDGGQRIPLGFQTLHLAFREGRLIITSEAGGIDAVLACERGFAAQDDVQEALAVLSQKTSCHIIMRHQPLMDQLLPYLGMAGVEAMQQGQAFADALPEQASWLRWRFDEQGLNASADGALNAMLLPVMAPLLAAPRAIN